MTGNLSDSDPEGTGTEGAPSSSGSAQKGDSGGSGQVALTKAELEALNQRIAKLESGSQSEKDRAVKRTNERIEKLESDIRPLLERAAKEGKSVADVLKDLDQQDEAEYREAVLSMAKAFKSGTFPMPAGGTQSGGGNDAAKVFADKGLDPSDPDVQTALRELTGKSPAEVELAAYRLRDRKTSQPNPTGAQSAALNRDKPVKVDLDALKADYDKEVAQFRGNPNAIATVKQKYREKGLVVW